MALRSFIPLACCWRSACCTAPTVGLAASQLKLLFVYAAVIVIVIAVGVLCHSDRVCWSWSRDILGAVAAEQAARGAHLDSNRQLLPALEALLSVAIPDIAAVLFFLNRVAAGGADWFDWDEGGGGFGWLFLRLV